MVNLYRALQGSGLHPLRPTHRGRARHPEAERDGARGRHGAHHRQVRQQPQQQRQGHPAPRSVPRPARHGGGQEGVRGRTTPGRRRCRRRQV